MKPIAHKKAWGYIEQMGWGRSSCNYNALAREWYAKLGPLGMKALEEFVGQRVSDLYGAVEKYEGTGKSLEIGSDDGMSDLTHHVVGLGQAEFDACIANPKLLENRYNKGDYKESFGYCFHEPEKPRTSEQKEQKLNELLKTLDEVTVRFKKAQKEFDQLSNIITVMSMTLDVVKHDKKSA